MSNKNCFKCLVELKEFKYCVILKNVFNFNEITFNSVLNEIQIQTKQNISYETHSFEIFDNDFNEYVLISSDKQIIDNLSRIKVLPKVNSIYSKSYENSRVSSIFSTKESQKSKKTSKSTLNSKSLIDLNSNSINPLNKVHNFLEFNDFNNSETVSLSSELNYSLNDEKSLSEKKVVNNSNTYKTESLSKPKYDSNNNTILIKCTNGSKPINYFGPKICCDRSPNSSQLYFQTKVEEIENISTIVLKFSSDEINAYKLLIQIMKENKHLFKNDSSKVDLKKTWKTLSNEMVINGFKTWKPQKCMDSLIGSVNLYKKVLENTPNYEIASRVYPLFESIHSVDLRYFIKTQDYHYIKELLKKFVLKSIKNNKTLDLKSNTSEGSQKLLLDKNEFDSIQEVYEQLNGLKLEEQQYEQQNGYEDEDKYVVIENWRLQTVIDFKLSETIKRFVIIVTVKYDNSSGQLPKKSTDLSTIKFRFLKTSSKDVTIFHSIVQFINESQEYFLGDFKSEDKWMRVSNKMLDIGYEEFTAFKCRELYQTFKSVYIQLLQYTPNYKIASQIFPLFALFHTMDLKCLSRETTYNKIMILRNRPQFHSNVV